MSLPDFFIATPPLAFRFGVLVTPFITDIFFQKVSGLSMTIETKLMQEGGQNGYTQQLPTGITNENLVLERGMLRLSPLSSALMDTSISKFNFTPSLILVTLLDHANLPIRIWSFKNAYPVKWSVSDLDADSNSVVIERMEFYYQSQQVITL